MPVTIIQSESFQTIGTLNSGSPGGLGSVTGSFYARGQGPTPSGGLARSADLRLVAGAANVWHSWSLGAAAARGIRRSWFYIDRLVSNGANTTVHFQHLYQADGTTQWLQILALTATGNFARSGSNQFAVVDLGVAVPLKQWFELRTVWSQVSGTTYSVWIGYRLRGAATWVDVWAPSNTNMNAAPSSTRGGNPSLNGASAYWLGRYGRPALATISAFSEKADLLTETDPAAPPYTWYLDPTNGSDTNDGTTSGTAFKSGAKVSDENTYSGFFNAPVAAWVKSSDGTAADLTANAETLDIRYRLGQGEALASLQANPARAEIITANSITADQGIVPGGDTLVVVANGGAEQRLTGTLTVSKTGMSVKADTGTASLTHFKVIPAGSWSLVSGETVVYQATDSASNAVLWEDRKQLTHVVASTLAGALPTLRSTAGSFWTDGVTMYVHPFGNTNPASDGKVYERSQVTGSGATGVALSASAALVKNISMSGTTLVQPTLNDAVGGYPIGINTPNSSALFVVAGCTADYGDKHAFGGVGGTMSNSRFCWLDLVAQRCSNYGGVGSTTLYVDFTNAGSSNQAIYDNCTSGAGNAQMLGSTAAQTRTDLGAWITHGSSTGFSTVKIINCNWSKAGFISIQNATTLVTATATTFGFANGVSAGDPNPTTFNRCKFVEPIVASGVYRNCEYAPQAAFTTVNSSDSFRFNTRQAALYNCTLDFSQAGGSTVWYRNSATAVLLSKCAVILPAGVGLISGATSTDAITITQSVFSPASGVVLASYNDGSTTANRTLAQLTTLGVATSCLSAASLSLDPTLYPLGSSPVINFTTDGGPAVDFTGATFAIRNDAGAYEYIATGQQLMLLMNEGLFVGARL